MKNKRSARFLSLMLTIVMLMGIFPMSAVAEDVPAHEIILAGDEVTVYLDGEDTTEAYYKFIPEEDGTYIIYSYNNDHDTLAYLYDSDMNEINSNDDGGDGNNFKIVTELTAGETYYIKARFWTESNEGEFNVIVEKGVPATGIKLEVDPEWYEFDRYYVDYYEFTPTNAIPESVTITSSDESVIKLDEGYGANALKPGKSTITITSANGLKDSVTVTVSERSDLTVDVPVIMGPNFSGYFKVKVAESGAYRVSTNGSNNGVYIYMSSAYDSYPYWYGNDYYNSEDQYIICELEADKQYVFECNNYSGDKDVEVILEKLVEATGVAIDADSCAGEAGQIIYPVVNSIPSNSVCGDYTITVKDESIACAGSDGAVELLKEGTTEITVTTSAGFSATAVLTVITHEHSLVTDYFTAETHDVYCETCDFNEYGAEHEFTDGTCICGYYEHEHVTDHFTTYNGNATEHMSVCSVCLVSFYYEHEFEDGFCVDCGYVEHEHEPDPDGYTGFYNYHMTYCTICDEALYDSHDYGDDDKCICGFINLGEHECVAGSYITYPNYHTVICSVCDMVMDYEDHDIDDRGVCVCGYVGGQSGVVNIGDIGLMDGEYLDANGNITTEKPAKWSAYFKDGVLTLNDISVHATDENCGIFYYEGDLEIVVNGYARFESDGGDAICVDYGNLTITGEGTLEAISYGNFDGIDSCDGDIVIDGPTVLVNAVDNGVEAYYDFVMNSGNLFVNAGDDGIDADYIFINGGCVQVYAKDNGIDASIVMEIAGGCADITAEDENGIEAGYALSITGGYINIDAGRYAVSVYSDNIEIDSAYGEIEFEYDEEEGGYVMVDGDKHVSEYTFTTETDDKTITSDMIDISKNNVYVFGKNNIPAITVTGKDGKALKEGTDYTVTWSDDKFERSGVYYAVIEGKGSYSGSEYAFFAITYTSVSVSGVELHAGEYLASGADSVSKTKPASGGFAYFNGEVLELNNYDNTKSKNNFTHYEYNGDSYTASVYGVGDITVKLVGKNTIVNTEAEGSGICAMGTVEFTGGGSVDVTASYGIESFEGSVVISGGTINVDAKWSGIAAYANSIYVYGGTVNVNADDGALYSEGAVFIEGGAVNASAYTAVESSVMEIYGGIVNLSGEYAISLDEGYLGIYGGYTKLLGYFGAVYGDSYDFDIDLSDGMMIHYDEETRFVRVRGYNVLYGEKEVVREVVFAADFENTLYGDANCDGKINLGDASLILKKIAKWNVSLNDITADVNADTKINLGDVSVLLKKIAGWDVTVGPAAQ